MYQDLTKLYTKGVSAKVMADYQSQQTPNVNEEVSSSILGQWVFSYVFPVINKASKMDQLDVDDLPAPHGYFQSQNILQESVVINNASGVQEKYGHTLSLLYTVWYPERIALLKGASRICTFAE